VATSFLFFHPRHRSFLIFLRFQLSDLFLMAPNKALFPSPAHPFHKRPRPPVHEGARKENKNKKSATARIV
jgi:hypothetical protein